MMRDSKSSGKKPIQEVQVPRAHKAKLERVSRDITKRKRVEEELKRSKEFLANIINALDDPVFVKDEKHRWVILNDAACEVMGRPREKLIGKTDYDLFPREQADVFWERDNSVLKSGETDVNEEEITWHGKLHTISTKKSVFTDSLTGKKFIAGTIRDITERKRAEEALRQSREKLRKHNKFLNNVLESLTHPFYVIDANDYTIKMANSATNSGRLKEDTTCFAFTHNRDVPCGGEEHSCPLKEIKKTKKPVTTEHIHHDGGGKERYVEVHGYPIFDSRGNVTGIIEYSLDITKRKKAEEELRETKEFLEGLIASMKDGFSVLDSRGVHIQVNRALCQMTGFSRQELIGVGSPHPYWPPGEYEKIKKAFENTCTGEFEDFEMIFKRKNGERFPVIVSPSWVKDEQGNVLSYFATVKDITERKKADEELKKSKDLLEKTFLSLNSAVFILDSKEPPTIIECNPAATGIFGYEKEEVVSKTTEFLHVSPETLLEFQKILYPAIQKQGHLSFSEFQMKRKNGQIFPTEHSVFPLKDNKGNRTGWVSVVRDITERKKAEEQLQKSQSLLNETGKMAKVGGWEFDVETLEQVWTEEVYRIHEVDSNYKPTVEAEISFYAPESRPIIANAVQKAIDNGEPFDVELQFITAKGNHRWVHAIGKAHQQGGKTIKVSGTFQDITERKRAEEALQESEASYRELTDSITDIFFAMDKDLRYTYWNKASEKLTGISAKDAIGKSIFEIFPDTEDTKRSVAVYREVLRTQQAQSFVNEYQLNGKDFFFEINAYPTKQGLSVFVKGITERKRVEKALRASEQRFRDVAESTGEWIWEVDTSGLYTYASPVVEKILGYKQEELVGKMHFYDLFAPDVRKDLKEAAFEVFSRRETFTKFVNPNVHKNGNIVFLETSGLPVLDKKGNFLGYRGADADITDRKDTEKVLQEREERLELFFSQSLDGFFFMMLDEPVRWDDTVDKEKVLDYVFAHQQMTKVNDAMLSQYGATRERFIGLTPNDFYAHDIAYGRDVWRRFFDAGRLHVETDERKLDGTQMWIEGDYICLYDSKGRIIGHFGIQRDITERKEAEERLLEYQAQLKSLASQLILAEEHERRRIAIELHDQISQSLVISKMKVEALRESASGKELNKALDEIANSLGQTIAETRSLTSEIHPPLLALLGFEEAVAEWLSEQIQKKHGIEAEFEDDGLPKSLDDDIRMFLFRDVRELLTNVVRHAHAHKVKVSIRKVDDKICVTVEDDGVGFDPAEVASIGLETNGFGLFSIQERLEQLGGHLEIEFEPGHGARVTITAPLKGRKNTKRR